MTNIEIINDIKNIQIPEGYKKVDSFPEKHLAWPPCENCSKSRSQRMASAGPSPFRPSNLHPNTGICCSLKRSETYSIQLATETLMASY